MHPSRRLGYLLSLVVLSCTIVLSGNAAIAGAGVVSSIDPVVTPSYPSGLADPLNPGSFINQVSCPSVGECVAVGYVTVPSDLQLHAMIWQMSGGVWQPPQPVDFSGLREDTSMLNSVSCSSKNHCAAVGSRAWNDYAGQWSEAVMVSIEGGTRWSHAQSPDYSNLSDLKTDHYNNALNSVSCPSDNNCVAAGQYSTPNTGSSSNPAEGAIVAMTNGSWGRVSAPSYGSSPAPPGPEGQTNFFSISCPKIDNCAAVGRDLNAPIVEVELNGTWQLVQTPTSVSGVSDTVNNATYSSVSCSTSGNCAAVGQAEFTNSGYRSIVSVVADGILKTTVAPATPDSVVVNRVGIRAGDQLVSISCPADGNCVAGGYVSTNHGQLATMVQITNGVVQQVVFPPFTALRSTANGETYHDAILGVSCASLGNCMVSGYYIDNEDAYDEIAFTWSMVNGRWASWTKDGNFIGLAEFSRRYEEFNNVSCSNVGGCVAVGFYTADSGQRMICAQQAPPVTAPGKPRNVRGTVTGASVKLRWNEPGSNGDAVIKGYRIEVSTNQQQWTTAKAVNRQRSFTATNLTRGTTYSFKISAINKVGLGPASKIITIAVT